jgi:hypothetical protein
VIGPVNDADVEIRSRLLKVVLIGAPFYNNGIWDKSAMRFRKTDLFWPRGRRPAGPRRIARMRKKIRPVEAAGAGAAVRHLLKAESRGSSRSSRRGRCR